jgi:hypothetical protein
MRQFRQEDILDTNTSLELPITAGSWAMANVTIEGVRCSSKKFTIPPNGTHGNTTDLEQLLT